MPTFDFTAPDGTNHSIDGPEGATREQAFQMLQLKLGGQSAPAAPQEGVVADTAKSAASGLATGAATAIGFPGDVASLAHSVAPQGLIDKVKAIPGAKFVYDHLPTSQAILDDASKNDRSLVDPNYEPQSATGRYTKAIASQAGPGLASGMGPLGVLSGAVAGQGVEDLTGSKTAGAVANLAGSLAAPWAMARRASVAQQALKGPAALKAEAKAVYNGPELSSAIVNQQSLKDLALNADQTLARRQFDPDAIGEVRKIIDNRWHGADQPQSIADLQNSRARLNELTQGVPSTQSAAARVVKDHLDDYLKNLQPNQIVAGDAPRAARLLEEANGNYHAQSSAKAIDDLIGNAQTDANGAGSGMNLGNTLRRAFKPLLKNDAEKLRGMGYGDDVINGVSTVNKGDFITNQLRRASNMLGGGGGIASTIIGHGVSGASGGMLGYEEGGLPGMALGTAIGAIPGQALRLAANARTKAAALRVQQQLLAKAPSNAGIVASNTAATAANKAAMRSALMRNGIPAAAMLLSKFNGR